MFVAAAENEWLKVIGGVDVGDLSCECDIGGDVKRDSFGSSFFCSAPSVKKMGPQTSQSHRVVCRSALHH